MSQMSSPAPARVLVAGVGNVFLGDDGFGVEVARRLAEENLPDGVRVADYGIRGVHLAFELCEGYDTAILIDAAPHGEAPGTVSVLEPELAAAASGTHGAAAVGMLDGHGMEPDAIFGLLATLGGHVGRVLVVGCEPGDVSERMGLSAPVAAAVDEAVRVVQELVGPNGDGREEG